MRAPKGEPVRPSRASTARSEKSRFTVGSIDATAAYSTCPPGAHCRPEPTPNAHDCRRLHRRMPPSGWAMAHQKTCSRRNKKAHDTGAPALIRQKHGSVKRNRTYPDGSRRKQNPVRSIERTRQWRAPQHPGQMQVLIPYQRREPAQDINAATPKTVSRA